MFSSPLRQQGVDRFTTADIVQRVEGPSNYLALQTFAEYSPISGTSSLTISSTAVITGLVDISGTTSVSFTSTSSLTGLGGLNGSSTVTFSGSGEMVATGSMAGSVTYTITGSGLLDSISSIAEMTATMTFSITGQLKKRIRPRQITVKTKYWL